MTRHAVVTGTHKTWQIFRHVDNKIKFLFERNFVKDMDVAVASNPRRQM
jgi:hypothetical protein